MWRDLSTFIRTRKNFVITTHINPEGDAIGSEVALAAFLRDSGKTATIVNSSTTPENCSFMDPTGDIQVYPERYTAKILEDADAIVIVDVNNWAHVGPFGDEIRKHDTPRVCIDHHVGADESFAEITVSDTKAAAAGLLVYDLIKYMSGTVTPRIAEAIYTAILTDTGSFRFSNTDERVFVAAAELCSKGAEPFTVYKQVYSKRWGAARLIGPSLGTLEKTPDGSIAWIHTTRSMFEGAGADYEDSDGLIELVRTIEGVELCLFFKELSDGRIKVSLRSNGKIDAYAIAAGFGGGGHRMAAGLSLDGPMSQAIETVVSECISKHPSQSDTTNGG